MIDYPVAPLFSFQVHVDGQGRFTVRCPHCSQIHRHRWFGNHVAFTATAPCSVGRDVRMYRVDLRAAIAERDDNAMHQHENNWIE